MSIYIYTHTCACYLFAFISVTNTSIGMCSVLLMCVRLHLSGAGVEGWSRVFMCPSILLVAELSLARWNVCAVWGKAD